jgi:hypothetical protein
MDNVNNSIVYIGNAVCDIKIGNGGYQ